MKHLLSLNNHVIPYLLGGSVLILSMFYAPILIVFLLIVLFALMVVLELFELLLWLGPKNKDVRTYSDYEPRISVHLAIYNECPTMVIKTIESILSQEYPDFELIIVDNNTADKELWGPVADFCKGRSGVRFFHLKKWPFFKSGALNFSRMLTSQDAEFIFVVDADYVLVPGALKVAVQHATPNNIALIQFPQAYRCNEPKHRPIIGEFDHFFNYYCLKANNFNGALATGTLSLIRIKALDSVGGWPTSSITEDAELGSRLQSLGFHIRYVHKVIGKGIVPVRQKDFLQQRKRWVFGNIQTLLGFPISPIKNFRKWVSSVSQLTAWTNLLGLPILCILSAPFIFMLYENENVRDVVGVSYMCFWLFLISKIIQLLLAKGRGAEPVKILLTHLSALAIGAFYWWPVLLGGERPFVKTDKTNAPSTYRINILYPIMHVFSFSVFLYSGNAWLYLSAGVFCTMHIASLIFDRHIRTDTGSNLSFTLKLTV